MHAYSCIYMYILIVKCILMYMYMSMYLCVLNYCTEIIHKKMQYEHVTTKTLLPLNCAILTLQESAILTSEVTDCETLVSSTVFYLDVGFTDLNFVQGDWIRVLWFSERGGREGTGYLKLPFNGVCSVAWSTGLSKIYGFLKPVYCYGWMEKNTQVLRIFYSRIPYTWSMDCRLSFARIVYLHLVYTYTT